MKLLQVKIFLILLLTSVYTFSQIVIDVPDIKYVSIDPYTNEIVVAWNASTSNNISFTQISYMLQPGFADTMVYIQGNKDDSIRFSLDTIKNDIIPTDSIDRSFGFAVAVYDINNNGSKSLYNYHTTCYLKSTFKNCPDRVSFEWSAYSTGKYAKIDIESYTLVGISNSTKKNFIVTGKDTRSVEYSLGDINGFDRFYLIVTFKNNDDGNTYTSRSNMTYTSEIKIDKPDFITINSVSVHGKEFEIEVSLDTNSLVKDYHIYTSFDANGKYQITDSTSLINPTAKNNTVLLSNLGSNIINYIKVYAIDNCNNIIDSSQYACNIVLSVDEAKPFENDLLWNPYCGWQDEGIKNYTIFRSNDDSEFDVFRYASSSVNTVSDNVEELSQTNSKFCYYLAATSFSNGFVSTSNTVCVEKTPRVFIPNTILPLSANEENKQFKIYSSFISPNGFQLEVYDRWGKLLFSSTNPMEGWDARVNGNYVQQGTYIYNLKYQTSTGKEVEKKGLVNVLFDK